MDIKHYYQERIPGSRLVLIPGNHFIANQNPTAFNRTVAAFLEQGSETGLETGND